MKVAVAAIVAFMLLVVAIVALAPAALVDRRIAAATRGQLRVADAAGTLWRGRGTLTDAQGAWRIPVGWRLDPAGIARGTLSITLAPPAGADRPRGDIELSEPGVIMRALAIEVPAQTLAGLTPVGGTLTLGGEVDVDAPSFEWSGDRGQGNISARWRGARVVSALGSIDLGLVEANLAPADNRLAGRIGNRGGDVRIDGTLMVDGVHARIEATIVPLPSTPPAVVRALAELGPPDASGAVRVAWTGNLQ